MNNAKISLGCQLEALKGIKFLKNKKTKDNEVSFLCKNINVAKYLAGICDSINFEYKGEASAILSLNEETNIYTINFLNGNHDLQLVMQSLELTIDAVACDIPEIYKDYNQYDESFAKIRFIRTKLNYLRGIFVRDFFKEDNTWTISFESSCQQSLKSIIESLEVCVMTSCINNYLTYEIMFEEDEVDDVCDRIESMFFVEPEIREELRRIEQYNSLNKECKRKYRDYVKFIRFINGGMENLEAREVLLAARTCDYCEEEIYSKENEMRTILEFDCPVKAYQILNEIPCGNEDLEDDLEEDD